jgi:hypothetical protein
MPTHCKALTQYFLTMDEHSTKEDAILITGQNFVLKNIEEYKC